MQNLATNFLKAKRTYALNSPIQRKMQEELLSLILSLKRKEFENIFEFGAGLAQLSKNLMKELEFKRFVYNDINDYALKFTDKRVEIRLFDMKDFSLQGFKAQSFDLIVSNACLQWLNFDKSLKDLSFTLKKGGVLTLSSFGEKNLEEIYKLTNLRLEYLSLETIKQKLELDYEILTLKQSLQSLKFNSALELFRHLKLSGVNSLGQMYLSKALLKRCEDEFKNTLTYNPIFILAVKK